MPPKSKTSSSLKTFTIEQQVDETNSKKSDLTKYLSSKKPCCIKNGSCYNKVVEESNIKPVYIFVYASYCPWCHLQARAMSSLNPAIPQYPLENTMLDKGIEELEPIKDITSGYPTIILMKDGGKLKKVNASEPSERTSEILESIYNSASGSMGGGKRKKKTIKKDTKPKKKTSIKKKVKRL